MASYLAIISIANTDALVTVNLQACPKCLLHPAKSLFLTIGPVEYRLYVEDTRCRVAEADGIVQAIAALDAAAASIWAPVGRPRP